MTYTPLVLPEDLAGGGALEVAAAVDQLRLQAGESEAAGRSAQVTDRVAEAIAAFGALAAAASAEERLKASGLLRRRRPPPSSKPSIRFAAFVSGRSTQPSRHSSG